MITNQDLTDPPHVLETGTTFLANAKLKAHQMAEFSNLPTLADDSGLSVDKLMVLLAFILRVMAGKLIMML